MSKKEMKVSDLPDNLHDQIKSATEYILTSAQLITEELKIEDGRVVLTAMEAALMHILSVYLVETKLDNPNMINERCKVFKENLTTICQKYRETKNP